MAVGSWELVKCQRLGVDQMTPAQWDATDWSWPSILLSPAHPSYKMHTALSSPLGWLKRLFRIMWIINSAGSLWMGTRPNKAVEDLSEFDDTSKGFE